MRIALICADLEENLGAGMLAAIAERAGHEVSIHPFDSGARAPDLARQIAADSPELVGLSMQFQHRTHDFLSLARMLREAGYTGHISSGGQFPSLAYREVLERSHGVDSVILHDGEASFAALLEALNTGGDLREVAGLALLSDDGVAMRTELRPLATDLDALPFPKRYRAHARHLGVPFIPIMAGRGCWGRCAYCSITTGYRDARSQTGGASFRLRSPANIADEIAGLWKQAGPSIFCFHDDNLLLPKPEATLERMRAIRAELDARGVGELGIVGKCRPDTLTVELAHALADLGVIRLYVGVENASEAGGKHLRRGTQQESVGRALAACAEAGIFTCYNLLVFEPDTRLEDVRENVAFVREHLDHPFNFCRAEPYYGTPLMRDLEARGTLSGSYLGYDYRLEDPRSELLFRISAAAFRERNFAPGGVGNRYMGLGYLAKVLEHFFGAEHPSVRHVTRRARGLSRAIAEQTADFLEQAIELAERLDVDDSDGVARATADLGMRIAAADAEWHEEMDDVEATTRAIPPRLADEAKKNSAGVGRMTMSAALSATLALSATACGNGPTSVDPPPPDSGMDATVVDPPPMDAGMDVNVVDPAPADAGMDVGISDPLPPDAGVTDAGSDASMDASVVDPPPADAGMVVDPAPSDAGAALTPDVPVRRLIDQWRDTSPVGAERSRAVALYAPPRPRLIVEREGESVRVRVGGVSANFSARWEAEGAVDGEGGEALWTPANDADHLRVGIRTEGGIAVLSLRAAKLPA
ncbi:MAG: radical SAM protein [Deltaproteobacteria bacterium]|nr:radical SAM protein [Deltaproteobacteria bacterium]